MLKKIILAALLVVFGFFSFLSYAEFAEYRTITLPYSVEKAVDKKLESYFEKISSRSLDKQSEMLRTIIVKIDVIIDNYSGVLNDVLIYIQNEVYKKFTEVNLDYLYEDYEISFSYDYDISGTYSYGNYKGKITTESDYPRKNPFIVEFGSDDFAFVSLTDEDGNFFFRHIPNHDYTVTIRKGSEILGVGKLNFNGNGYDDLEISMKTFSSTSGGGSSYNPLDEDNDDGGSGGDGNYKYGDFSGVLKVDDPYLVGMPFTIQLRADGLVLSTLTDEDGIFKFYNIPNLDYKLQVRFNGVLLVNEQLTFKSDGYGNVYLDADIRYNELYGAIGVESTVSNDFASSDTISSHSMVRGQIDSNIGSEKDMYKFTATENGMLTLKLSNKGSTIYKKLALYDENKDLLESETNLADGSGKDFYINYLVEEGKQYYIEVSGNDDDEKYVLITYLIGQDDMDNNEPHGTLAQATEIKDGEWESGNIFVEGEEDYYKVVVDKSGTLVATLNRCGDGSSIYRVIDLIASDGKYISYSYNWNEDTVEYKRTVSPGTYYIKISGDRFDNSYILKVEY